MFFKLEPSPTFTPSEGPACLGDEAQAVKTTNSAIELYVFRFLRNLTVIYRAFSKSDCFSLFQGAILGNNSKPGIAKIKQITKK